MARRGTRCSSRTACKRQAAQIGKATHRPAGGAAAEIVACWHAPLAHSPWPDVNPMRRWCAAQRWLHLPACFLELSSKSSQAVVRHAQPDCLHPLTAVGCTCPAGPGHCHAHSAPEHQSVKPPCRQQALLSAGQLKPGSCHVQLATVALCAEHPKPACSAGQRSPHIEPLPAQRPQPVPGHPASWTPSSSCAGAAAERELCCCPQQQVPPGCLSAVLACLCDSAALCGPCCRGILQPCAHGCQPYQGSDGLEHAVPACAIPCKDSTCH